MNNQIKPIFIVDFDSTIADSISAFCKVKDDKIRNEYYAQSFIEMNSLKPNKIKIEELEYKAENFIHTNPNDVNRYDFTDVYPEITKDEVQEIFASWEFFDELKLFPYAYEVLEKLNEKYRVIICSIGTSMNISLKSIYINKKLPFIKDVILIRNGNCEMNKSMINMDNVIAFLDDHEDNLFNSKMKILNRLHCNILQMVKQQLLKIFGIISQKNLLQDFKYCYGDTKSWNEKWNGNRLRDWLDVAKQFNINMAEVKENNNKMEENEMENANKELMGYCKECVTEVYSDTQIEEHEIWECPNCYHPNSKDDLFPIDVQFEELKM